MAIPSSGSPSRTPAVIAAFRTDMDLAHLRALLNDPSHAHDAVTFVDDQTGPIRRQSRPVYAMLSAAARAGRADLVAELFAFALDKSVPVSELIDRHSIVGAISSERVDVVAEFVAVQPVVVNHHLGLLGDPLGQAIMGPYRAAVYDKAPEVRIPLIEYLLNKGANPNATACQFTRPGYHLYSAIRYKKPLEFVRLLLDHGAQIAGSGAVVTAAETGRLDVLELLCQRGADLGERLGTSIVYAGSAEETARRANETPLEAAQRKDQDSVVKWFHDHGMR